MEPISLGGDHSQEQSEQPCYKESSKPLTAEGAPFSSKEIILLLPMIPFPEVGSGHLELLICPMKS